MFALGRDGEVGELIASERDEWNGSVSPDGRWLLYELADDGRSTNMLTTWPPGERRWEVSAEGGRAPCWSRDGREIYFLDLAQQVVAVAVELAGGAPRFKPPQTLFALGSQAEDFDTRDGRTFLVGCGFEEALGRGYDLVLNWPGLLQNPR